MLSLALARELRDAGLVWEASENDFFAIPDRGLDERVFVLADMQAQLDVFRGWPVVTFHGTAEWALDYILTTEVVWIPREDQLIDALLSLLPGEFDEMLTLTAGKTSYRCTIAVGDQQHQFDAATAADAYGNALLFTLENFQTT